MAAGGRRTPRAFLRRYTKAAIGVAAAGAVAPMVLMTVLAGREGRRRALRFYRRWRRVVLTEFYKWR